MYNQSYLIKQIHIITLLIVESKKTSNICVLLLFFFSFSFKEKTEYYKEKYCILRILIMILTGVQGNSFSRSQDRSMDPRYPRLCR